jgi:hypothetical protein
VLCWLARVGRFPRSCLDEHFTTELGRIAHMHADVSEVISVVLRCPQCDVQRGVCKRSQVVTVMSDHPQALLMCSSHAAYLLKRPLRSAFPSLS